MKYGKITEGTLQTLEVEKGVQVGGKLTEEEIIAQGYKPVCEVEQPSDAEFCVYREYDVCFVQIWKRTDEEVQDHTTQSNWSPGNQSSLWVEVVEDHEGTLEDPIPYNEELNPMWQGMILEEGKYYTQSGVVYKCIRNTGNKVTHNLADLVSGGFVQKV